MMYICLALTRPISKTPLPDEHMFPYEDGPRRNTRRGHTVEALVSAKGYPHKDGAYRKNWG